MSAIEIFYKFSSYIIEIMVGVCLLALMLRLIAHRANKNNQAYFNSFSSSIIKHLEEEEDRYETVDDVDVWLENLLNAVEEHLPDRSLRFKRDEANKRQNLGEYTDGKRSIILAMKQQSDALKSPHPPNFNELADRVLNQDNTWRSVLKVLPFESLNRGLDILPNLFIVGGIFGTFIGITNALPMIASIDITKLAEASPVLNQFVGNVAYSMNTSIAGIAFSVVMTLVIALFPLASIREEVAKNFERAIEFMWYRIHGNKLSHGEYHLIKTLEANNRQLIGVLQSIDEKLSEQEASKFKRGA